MTDEVGQIGIGMVCPFDMALDRELWRWMPDSVSLHITRTPYLPHPVDVELCSELADHATIDQAVRSVMAVRPSAVGYACASGSFVRGMAGASAISTCMRMAGAPAAVTTSEALLRALDAMDLGRIAVATPYVTALTDLLCDYLAESGRSVVSQAGLGRDHDIWTIPYGVTCDLIRAADSDDADAVFVSCTNLPTYDVLAMLEHELGKPVLSANQVTAWASLQDAVRVSERPTVATGYTFAEQSLFARGSAA
ncbi:Asp/Glu/hydantoin racemase [Williamsia sp.]|uniref:maleate cis-trans isomerase family protein n=1 Tax=Williamsia sp. TaxID=1872085 RepID=UPI0025FCE50F|nr:Asp/Glu/hydantoin racemase [Williamsia sp.]